MSALLGKEESKKNEIDKKQLRVLPISVILEFIFSLPPHKGAFILGPPGIGKTESVLKYAFLEARKLGKEPVFLNEVRASLPLDDYIEYIKDIMRNPKKYYIITMITFGATNPDDLIGVPNIVTIKNDMGKVIAVFEESALKGSLGLLTIKDVYGLLLIDDALNTQDNITRSFLQAVFQERVVGGSNGVKLSSNVRVIATGNLASESELVTPLQRPMVGRAFMFYAKPEPLESWYKRMQRILGDKWFKEVYAFLKRYEHYYNAPELIEEEIPTGPVPRSWSLLAEGLYANRDKVKKYLETEEGKLRLIGIVSSAVGVEAAIQFVTFISKPVVSVDEVLRNPKKLDEVVQDMDLTFRFALQLGSKIDKILSEKEKEVYKYLKLIVDLMEKTTNDIGAFIYSVLSDKSKKKLKEITLDGIRSNDALKKMISSKIRRTLIQLAIADALSPTK